MTRSERLSKSELLDRVVESVYRCGWNALFLERNESKIPFLIHIYNHNESFNLRVYIWNITHGGGDARARDEFRIQITGTRKFERDSNERAIILGWRENDEIFVGFDFEKHTKRLGASPSFQIREAYLRDAHLYGISFCPKDNKEIAVAFRPEFFIEYVRNIQEYHAFGRNIKDLKAIQTVASDPSVSFKSIESVSNLERRRVIVSLKKTIRDNSFRDRVMTAYSHKCAFCGMQLDLVEAAHILPVSVPKSTDETGNGIAMCALHHKAYDNPNYS